TDPRAGLGMRDGPTALRGSGYRARPLGDDRHVGGDVTHSRRTSVDDGTDARRGSLIPFGDREITSRATRWRNTGNAVLRNLSSRCVPPHCSQTAVVVGGGHG